MLVCRTAFDAPHHVAITSYPDGRVARWELRGRQAVVQRESAIGPEAGGLVAVDGDLACVAWQEEAFGDVFVSRFDSDLEILVSQAIPGPALLGALAVSGRHRSFVMASLNEEIAVVDDVLRVRARMPGGAGVSGIAFDPEQSHFAAICTEQGGGHVSVFRLDGPDGDVRPVHMALPAAATDDLADTFGRTAFSPDGRTLLVKQSQLTPFTRIVAHDVASGHEIWRHEPSVAWVMANPAGSDEVDGGAMGYVDAATAFVVTARGRVVLFLDAATGNVLREWRLDAPVTAAAVVDGVLWGAGDDGTPRPIA